MSTEYGLIAVACIVFAAVCYHFFGDVATLYLHYAAEQATGMRGITSHGV